MIFENPNAFWSLLVLLPLVFFLSLRGLKAKKEAFSIFHLDYRHFKRKQVEKYVLAGIPIILLVFGSALPKVAFSSYEISEKTGEVALLVDVSGSMAAQKDASTPNRLDRAKPILYKIVDSVEELGQVKISLYGMTNIARSHVPFISKEDYPYLRESIDKILNVNSTPGLGTSFGQPILNLTDKFSTGEQTKLIVLLSDGEPFLGGASGMTDYEKGLIEQAVKRTSELGIKVITIGIGEPEGAKIPILNAGGEFTGEYNQLPDYENNKTVDYVSCLDENNLNDISDRMGGEYFSENDTDALLKFINDNIGTISVGEIIKEVKMYRSIASWFILGSIPFWIILARRYLLV